ncbi:hypothetical protein pEaSNUABM29_00021 [Erwinia phage pEa_SNUABM_29]|nr:hypothetical protein pEaSNUABM29_00021 [Erwinia phage pEa_SNUABM_29]
MPMRTILDGIAEELRRIGVQRLNIPQDALHAVVGNHFDRIAMDIYNRMGARELCLWLVELAICHGEFYHPRMHRVMICRVDMNVLPSAIYNRLYRAMERGKSVLYEEQPQLFLINREGEAGVFYDATVDAFGNPKVLTRRRETSR